MRAEREARAQLAEQQRAQAELKAQRAQAALEAQKIREESQLESAAPAKMEGAYDGTRSLAEDIAEDIAEGDTAGEGEDPALASLPSGALVRPDNVRAFPQGDA